MRSTACATGTPRSIALAMRAVADGFVSVAAPVAGMMGCMGAIMQGLSEDRVPDNHISGGVESLRIARQIAAVIQREPIV